MSRHYKELLLGCGSSREKRIVVSTQVGGTGLPEWCDLTTLDLEPSHNPDVVADLKGDWHQEHFAPNTFDEVHAYEVLEHLGQQGDWRTFLHDFYKIWWVLKPNGYLCATVPSRFSPWLWGDIGHTRAVLPESLIFLSNKEYAWQIGKTAMSDYRAHWRGDFEIERSQDDKTLHRFVLRAVKPARRPEDFPTSKR